MVKACKRCGTEFDAGRGYAKYCPDCRIVVKAEATKNREWGDKAGQVHNCDSDERIAICLSCTMPPKRCNGYCEKIRLASANEKRGKR